ncbi:MAG: branched-chain amino acid ABC transporter permease, partial [Acutalibacteraceae bacterium]|nr:branched-chain amino acid ABC transporter permease [Acutalibacteraceae bacterium]
MEYIKNIKKSYKLKYNITYYIIIAVVAVMSVMSVTGDLKRSTMGLLARIAYSIIMALSLNLVVGFLGELSLGHGGFMCVGAYIGCFCANFLHNVIGSPLLVLIISMVIGGLSAALFGFIIGLPALRLKGDYLAIVTLAFGEIVRNIFKNLPWFGGAMGLSTVTYSANSLFIVGFVVVILVLFLSQNLIRSKHGRAVTAIRDNEIAAKAMGINVTFYKLLIFVISAAFAGVAGVIYGHFTT